ncbi:hypothetical protein XCR1_1160006 [Xenorhabdus cabanillasii JM26]|uniref:Winged helix-turn helix protein n=2 Tax=Xenorhabdus cabanillasii TaxID=351673 RepID=A0A3D9UUX9_9GAMM|nr:integrase [Xenorhabdus cabanillasii JM26]REF28551.1 winged helix-turn helix protein [Xenorhabdus cabanillasii]CDL79493.1 hypothetical protein XCR1_1160006 [Xenorhabdus cabanillasii JM26]
MIHTNNPIIKHKAGLLNLAEELGNVSKACKVMGVSRDAFYRYRELAEQGGVYILPLMISTLRKQKRCHRKLMVSVNVFTKRYYRSFIKLRFVRSFIATLKRYNLLLMNGCITIIMFELTKEKCAVVEHQ